MITPWGAAPLPRSTCLNEPSLGASRPSVPLRWPQYQMEPSGAAAVSREPEPGATGKYFTRNGPSWACAPRSSAGVVKIAAVVEARNWRRFIALPRLLNGKVSTLGSTCKQHSPAAIKASRSDRGLSVHICLRPVYDPRQTQPTSHLLGTTT